MNKLEQAARQALVALEDVMADFDGSWALADTAITALREALAEPVKQSISKEAFNWIDANAPMFVREAIANTRSSIRSTSEYSEQAEQEPVAWRWPTHSGYAYAETHFDGEGGEPIYANPVRTKDLTDDEIVEIMKRPFNQREYLEQFARAIIAAYKEKNNV